LENKRLGEILPNIDMKAKSYNKFEDEKGNICKEHYQTSYIDPIVNQKVVKYDAGVVQKYK